MDSKMCSSMWFMSIVALMVVDVRTGALHQESEAHRCHQCSPTNSTACEQHAGWLTATCPGARPYCATIAQAPDFSSSLGCAARAASTTADEPCSLTNSPRQTLELTCICIGHLCNAPFSNKLRNELLNFSSNSNESSLTEAFFKLSNFANVTASDIYKTITVATAEVSVSTEMLEVVTVVLGNSKSETLPRAEPLKQQATAPSDDDEDEGEGSGAGADEAESARAPPPHAAAPAPPSSYLPSNDNAAHLFTPSLFTPILLATFII